MNWKLFFTILAAIVCAFVVCQWLKGSWSVTGIGRDLVKGRIGFSAVIESQPAAADA